MSDILETQKNRGTINVDRHIVPRKGKASMRDYSKMTDEEFIKAYETPLSLEEERELHSIAVEQINNAQVHEVTRDRLDAIVQNAKIRRCRNRAV